MEKIQVVGIDIAKLKFDVCAIFGEKTRKKIFTNNASGLKDLIAWIAKALSNPHFYDANLRVVIQFHFQSFLITKTVR